MISSMQYFQMINNRQKINIKKKLKNLFIFASYWIYLYYSYSFSKGILLLFATNYFLRIRTSVSVSYFKCFWWIYSFYSQLFSPQYILFARSSDIFSINKIKLLCWVYWKKYYVSIINCFEPVKTWLLDE